VAIASLILTAGSAAANNIGKALAAAACDMK
jgi:hypothetical protein